jgi:hypothetical protein
LFAEVPLDARVSIAYSVGTFGAGCAIDREVGNVEIELETMRQPIVGFGVEGILAKIWILRGLKAVELVEELEVKCPLVSDVSVVGIEGHLSEEPRRREREECQQEKPRWIWHAGESNIPA